MLHTVRPFAHRGRMGRTRLSQGQSPVRPLVGTGGGRMGADLRYPRTGRWYG